jgi:hypothetical protein
MVIAVRPPALDGLESAAGIGAAEMKRVLRTRLLMAGVLVVVGLASWCAGALAAPAGRTLAAKTAGQALAVVRPPAVAGTPADLVAVSGQVAWAVVDTVNGGDRAVRTADGGRTWRDVTPAQARTAAVFVFSGASDAWAGTGRDLLATTDAGVSWHRAGELPAGCMPLQFVNARHGWCESAGAAAGSESLDLYRTADGGRIWSLVSRTRWSGSAPGSLPFGCDKAIRFSSASVGSAGQNCAGYVAVTYLTTDGGSRWTARRIAGMPASLARPEISIGPATIAGRTGAGAIMVDGSAVLLGRTNSAGQFWRAVVPPGGLAPWSADIVSPLVWRLATAERILATGDGGRTWRVIVPEWPLPRVSPRADLPVIDFVSSSTGWAEFDYRGHVSTLRTTNGGVSWRITQTP